MSPEIAIAVLLNRRPGTDGSCPFLVHLLIRFLGRTGPISELTCPPGRGILRAMDGAGLGAGKTGGPGPGKNRTILGSAFRRQRTAICRRSSSRVDGRWLVDVEYA